MAGIAENSPRPLEARIIGALDQAKAVPGPEQVDPKSGDIGPGPITMKKDGLLTSDEVKPLVPTFIGQQQLMNYPMPGFGLAPPVNIAAPGWFEKTSQAQKGTVNPAELMTFLATLRPIERDSLAVKVGNLETAIQGLTALGIKPENALVAEANAINDPFQFQQQQQYQGQGRYTPPDPGNKVLEACEQYTAAHNDLLAALQKYGDKAPIH